jgi:hypothetical protein
LQNCSNIAASQILVELRRKHSRIYQSKTGRIHSDFGKSARRPDVLAARNRTFNKFLTKKIIADAFVRLKAEN